MKNFENMLIQEVNVRRNSLAMYSLPHHAFADTFKCELQTNLDPNIDILTRAVFSTFPGWITLLLVIRNEICRPLGLKTSFELDQSNNVDELYPGSTVGVFKVIDRRIDEILLGEDDKHLDFRVSLQIENDAERFWLSVTTVVRINSWVGKIYFFVVEPIHKLVIPAMMKSGLEKLAVKV